MENEELIDEFISEALEALERAETLLLEMEEDFDLEKLNSVFRSFHTIKGNSSMFQLETIRKLAHEMESILDLLRNQKIQLNKSLIDVLLKSNDFLRTITKDCRNEDKYDVSVMISELKKILGTSEDKSKEENTEIFTKISQSSSDFIEISEANLVNFIDLAQKNESYLYQIVINLKDQTHPTLENFLEDLEKKNWVSLFKSIYSERITNIYANPIIIPYNILCMVKSEVADWKKDFNLDVLQQKLLYIPEKKVQKTTSAVNADDKMSTSDGFIRVKIGLLDDLINLVGETIITRNQLLQRAIVWNDPEGTAILSRMSQLVTQLHAKIMHTRLQELNTIYPRLNRIVRDTSKNLNKKVELQLEGGEVELDKTMIDTLLEEMVHILRNSIDHGIESPEERKAKGKPETGRILILSTLQTGNVRIEIEDDGKGLDYERIKQSAIKKGLINLEQSETITKEELEEILFLPGISSKEQVTETSGRGVGMDAVRTSFKKLGGSIKLTGAEGKGTKVIATIPQTVSIISCLLVSVNNRKFAIFQKYISELIKFDPEKFSIVNGHGMYRLREFLIPLVDLKKLMFKSDGEITSSYIVIVRSDRYFYGLLFDEMLGTEEIVMKPLGEHFKGVQLFSGATIMGDGEAVLILDVMGIASHIGLHSIEIEKHSQTENLLAGIRSYYLIFESSGQRFASVSNNVVSIINLNKNQIFRFAEMDVIEYKEDIVPVIQLEELYEIEKKTSASELYAIICQVEKRYLGILIHKIVDVADNIKRVASSDEIKGEGVIGHAIYQEQPTIIIDAYEILKKMNQKRYHWIGKRIEALSAEEIEKLKTGIEN